MSFMNQLLENFKKDEFIVRLKNILGVDLADMQLISKCNKGIRYLLCAIDIFSKYAQVVPVKDKKGVLLLISKYFKSKSILKTAQKENQTKYGLIKAANFITAFSKSG